MTALMDATAEDIAALSAVTEMLVEVDRTIGSLLAARDGLLALGSRIAVAAASHLEEPNADAVDLSARAVAAEFGAALHISDRTVQRRMLDAEIVVTQFPRVWRAQGAGLISAAHSRVIVEAGAHLDDDSSRDAYAAQMVAVAQSESPNRVARMARRIADRYQRRSVDDRHADARRRREVRVKDRADGMAELSVLGPAALVHGAFARLTEMAKDTRAMADAPHDDRTLGQTRCDLALDVPSHRCSRGARHGRRSAGRDHGLGLRHGAGAVADRRRFVARGARRVRPDRPRHGTSSRRSRTGVGPDPHPSGQRRRAGRRSVSTIRRAEAAPGGAGSTLSIPDLRIPRQGLRSRPHPRSCPRRCHRVGEPRIAVSPTPHARAFDSVACRTPR